MPCPEKEDHVAPPPPPAGPPPSQATISSDVVELSGCTPVPQAEQPKAEDRIVKSKFTCTECHETVEKYSEFLLLDPNGGGLARHAPWHLLRLLGARDREGLFEGDRTHVASPQGDVARQGVRVEDLDVQNVGRPRCQAPPSKCAGSLWSSASTPWRRAWRRGAGTPRRKRPPAR